MIVGIVLLVLLCVLVLVGLRTAFALPHSGGPQFGTAPDQTTPHFAPRLAALVARHQQQTGVYALSDGQEALACRLSLIALAQTCIDIQYYIWNNDLSGQLILNAILVAADRGVRVRIIVDDNTTSATETLWAATAQHPNIAICLFNPLRIRRPRSINYLIDFVRINRRMHNKCLLVDGQACIVGGRNIGNEYFSSQVGMHFFDLDLLAVGAVVPDVAASFDEYWRCESVYDAKGLLAGLKNASLPKLRSDLTAQLNSDDGKDLMQLLADFKFAARFKKANLALEWTMAELVVDNPKKGRGKIPRRDLMVGKLTEILQKAEHNLNIASAYFVPGVQGTRFLTRLSRRGVVVQVLTNSLSSNVVLPVHAGYARYRKKLLKGKVDLFELKINRREKSPPEVITRRIRRKFWASSSSLHAKVFVVDRQDVLISSFNFDPRSTYLNCEMGILVHSPKMARAVLDIIADNISHTAYRPLLLNKYRLVWLDMQSRPMEVLGREPDTRFGKRFLLWCVSWLPLEWLL
ncbi:MAG: phospholipase D family protein [Alphaproteobacteria bacterium]|nr:phospholipase D family protein [Alphaproteobacteria bacterium]